MTRGKFPLVFDSGNRRRPQTHALLLGVGSYPRLRGGANEAGETYGLGQLESPPLSARKLATCLIERRGDLLPPLGSVELLASGGAFTHPDGATVALRPPRFGAIKGAFNRWRQRCEANPENFALFYFCGHGVERDALLLFAEDILTDEHRIGEHAIDFDKTNWALASRNIGRQLFLLDCCRNVPGTMQDIETIGVPLFDWDRSKPDAPNRATFLAAARGQTAHAPPRGVSYFTQAIIDGLMGRAADRKSEDAQCWLVTTSRLVASVTGRMRELGFDWSPGRDVAAFDILTCARAIVPTSVDSAPPEALRSGSLHVCERGGVPFPAPAPRGDRYQFELLDGTYSFRASFSKDQHPPVSAEQNVGPPSHHWRVKV